MATIGDITPYTIDIPQADLDDLRERLARTRWPDALPGQGWDRGVDLDYLMGLAEYWRTGYDWRTWEARLNRFPQFTTTIDGANIHFLHVRSPEQDATPLILTHGWPGSIVEFIDVIEPLTNPRAHGGDPADAFHVVVPSLPGYGFSGPTTEGGWTPKRIANAWATLMARLDYDRYGAQGGDWGRQVSRLLGIVDADHVIGVHVNSAIGQVIDWSAFEHGTDEERAAAQANQRYMFQLSGYMWIQATRPPDDRLRPDRFAGRSARLDRRHVQPLDRLGHVAGRRCLTRSHPHRRDALLADRHRRLRGPALQRAG